MYTNATYHTLHLHYNMQLCHASLFIAKIYVHVFTAYNLTITTFIDYIAVENVSSLETLYNEIGNQMIDFIHE